MATKENVKDLFVDTKTVADESEEEILEHDDLKEGFLAEEDPTSKMKDPLAAHKEQAEDVVRKSLDTQLTALGRKTAEMLNKQPKIKIVIPIKELNPDDEFVVIGTNGWNTQIKRGVPVELPEEIYHRLAASGENPTMVR